jgi:error-prone DNA polymerase
MVEGELQIEGEVIHVIVSKCYNVSRLLHGLVPYKDEDISFPQLRPDETTAPPSDARGTEKRDLAQEKIFHEGRNFR